MTMTSQPLQKSFLAITPPQIANLILASLILGFSSFALAITPSTTTNNGITTTTTTTPTPTSIPTPTATTTVSVQSIPSNVVISVAGVPLDQAAVKPSSILSWASDAAKSVYSYDFKNYKKQMQNNQQYFTDSGWKAFNDALNKSNNLKTVENKKLVASAVTTGIPTIMGQGIKKGRFTWKVYVPLLATYENESKMIKQNLSITMLITRTNKAPGIGITHFIAEMMPQANQPITAGPASPTTISPAAGTTTSVNPTDQTIAPNTLQPMQTTPVTPSTNLPNQIGTPQSTTGVTTTPSIPSTTNPSSSISTPSAPSQGY